MCIYIYIHALYIYIYIYICTYAYTYADTYTHTHTHTQISQVAFDRSLLLWDIRVGLQPAEKAYYHYY